MTYGLRDTDFMFMNNLFCQHPDVEQVWLYGFRAKGTNQPGADVDLALIGPDVTPKTVSHIHFVLEEESPTPFFFDVIHWDTIKNENLKHEIERTGSIIYNRLSWKNP